MSLLDVVAEARRSGDLSGLVGSTPYNKFMNIAPENSTGELLTRMRFSPPLIGNMMLPALHGGTIGALLESAAIFQVLWEVETIAIPKIITITVDHFSPFALGFQAVPQGDYNHDGNVDAADYVVWRKGLGDTYEGWRTNFGRLSGGSGASSDSASNAGVPEPAAAVMLFTCIVAISLRRGRVVR